MEVAGHRKVHLYEVLSRLKEIMVTEFREVIGGDFGRGEKLSKGMEMFCILIARRVIQVYAFAKGIKLYS